VPETNEKLSQQKPSGLPRVSPKLDSPQYVEELTIQQQKDKQSKKHIFVGVFETGSHYVVLAGLELKILLPQPP
jgi:hypothetical protein